MQKFILFLILASCLGIAACISKAPAPNSAGKTEFSQPPSWAKNVIWYQIFVERFRNGDPDNDPSRHDIDGSYPGFVPESWQITPWTHDWYKPDPYFADMTGKPDFGGSPVKSFGQKAQLRRYGGDLQGVLDKLDYLDSLGVTAIYFNPLNDAPSLHKYDARNWRHIDRNFGPTPQEDERTIAGEDPLDPAAWQMTGADHMFVDLIKQLHDRGMRVILDFSWNHTGTKFWAWQDILKNGIQSQFKDWYWIQSFDNPDTPENEFKFRGWFGVHNLPEIKETVYHDHAGGIQSFEGDLASAAAKQHIFNVSRRWLDPNGDGDPSDGVDGFRLDVAAEVPLGFWRDYRKFIRQINPQAYLLGEVWWEKYPDHLLDPQPFLQGDIFDAVMNYRWYRAARHFFNEAPDQLKVSAFVGKLNSLRENLNDSFNYAMMNLTASHDTPRFATSMLSRKKYKFNMSPFADADFKIGKPDAATYERMKLLLVQQFTYVGAPAIWAGDEMGMWGSDDPDSRKPLIWPDFQFEPEKIDPRGKIRKAEAVQFEHALFDFYRNLIKIRKANAEFSSGKIEFVFADDAQRSFAYSRFDDHNESLVAFNLSPRPQKIQLPLKFIQEYSVLFGNIETSQPGVHTIQFVLPAKSAVIIASNRD